MAKGGGPTRIVSANKASASRNSEDNTIIANGERVI